MFILRGMGRHHGRLQMNVSRCVSCVWLKHWTACGVAPKRLVAIQLVPQMSCRAKTLLLPMGIGLGSGPRSRGGGVVVGVRVPTYMPPVSAMFLGPQMARFCLLATNCRLELQPPLVTTAVKYYAFC